MTTASRSEGFLVPGSRKRRLVIATALYVVCTLLFALLAARQTLTEHTPFNHYALQADAWLHGRQDIDGGPPAYAMGNDFASFDGKTYISFPPFPAALMLPFVALAGSAENFRDGQFIVWLAGLAPAFLFLVLEKLRRPDASGATGAPLRARLRLLLHRRAGDRVVRRAGRRGYGLRLVCPVRARRRDPAARRLVPRLRLPDAPNDVAGRASLRA